MLEDQKILITGATGRVAFPIARALAARNEVWGVARFTDPDSWSRLESVGVRPLLLDMSTNDFSSCRMISPTCFMPPWRRGPRVGCPRST